MRRPLAAALRPDDSTVEAGDGFEVHRHIWALHRAHGPLSLADAVRHGRTVGPQGERLVWLDTETTGLAGGTGTYVFLIGLTSVDDGCCCLTQYFLRHLHSEGSMLRALAEELRRYDAVVTFNGASFDLPLLQTRLLLCHLRGEMTVREHLDLMMVARTLWYRRLGGYSLSLIERAVLRIEREGDVPGWLIPSLYVRYLRTGDLDEIEPVFAHNAQDLLSLMTLHGVVGLLLQATGARPDASADGARPDGPLNPDYPGDHYGFPVDYCGLARLLERRSELVAAEEVYRLALREERDPRARCRATLALARVCRRAGRIDELIELWSRERAASVLPAWLPLERLAMAYEWLVRDPVRALQCTVAALENGDGMDSRVSARLDHRRTRLVRKTQEWSGAAGGGQADVR